MLVDKVFKDGTGCIHVLGKLEIQPKGPLFISVEAKEEIPVSSSGFFNLPGRPFSLRIRPKPGTEDELCHKLSKDFLILIER